MNKIKSYHAHFYYDEATSDTAKNIYNKALELELVQIGDFHTRPVGPHPVWSFQIGFTVEDLSRLIPWLTLNREELSVLIHPLTGDDYKDHTEYAMWLGKKEELKVSRFLKD